MWVQRWWQGLIPARAGTTLWGHLLVRRGCGSSPLARGPLISDAINIITGRLIPARAGTTPRSMMSGWPTGAHPRSRGDHILELFGLACGWGSSPLARGPRHQLRQLRRLRGLIPARAGTTAITTAAGPGTGAHPRSRGDHAGRREYEELREGSSPLARGPRVLRLPQSPRPGLIPARAGTTPFPNLQSDTHRAHPRSRGDHLATFPLMSVALGSSPLARGPLAIDLPSGEYTGLIPARAGTTGPSSPQA